MTTAVDHPLVRAYLAELDRALAGLPESRRREIREGVVEHLEESIAEAGGAAGMGSGSGSAAVRTILDRLGEPEEIAAEAGAPPRRGAHDPAEAAPHAQRSVWREYLALAFLPFGGLLVPILGWAVGAALLWSSPLWTTRDKLIGTLLVPGGYMTTLFVLLLSSEACIEGDSGPSGCDAPTPFLQAAAQGTLLLLLVLTPLASAIYLAVRLRRTRRLG